MPVATILQIMRMSTEDGPGLRTTVFFKGCSLRCSWCHNPESIAARPELQWIGSRCIGCGTCVKACPRGALAATDRGIVIDRDKCDGCGTCAVECPTTALELMGERWEVDALVAEVAKDAAYFAAGQGGVTASGGEPLMQVDFLVPFFAALRARGIPTALDTCGQCATDALTRALPHADLVLFDLKEADAARHARFTGVANDRIATHLRLVSQYVADHDLPSAYWVRTPIIPGATDRPENIAALGRLIASLPGAAPARWELCSFNNLCRDKYTRLGRAWDFATAELLTRETMETLAATARASGVDPAIVHWTGATRVTETG